MCPTPVGWVLAFVRPVRRTADNDGQSTIHGNNRLSAPWWVSPCRQTPGYTRALWRKTFTSLVVRPKRKLHLTSRAVSETPTHRSRGRKTYVFIQKVEIFRFSGFWSIINLKAGNIYSLWVKKLDPSTFKHNIGKYCPISVADSNQLSASVLRSLPPTPNLLVHYLVSSFSTDTRSKSFLLLTGQWLRQKSTVHDRIRHRWASTLWICLS